MPHDQYNNERALKKEEFFNQWKGHVGENTYLLYNKIKHLKE